MAAATVRRAVLGFSFLLLPATGIQGQEQGTRPPESQQVDSVTLVFEREVFFYPQYERRNPFAPLLEGEEGGPRFEGLRLLGILASSDPRASVALLGPRMEQTNDPSRARTYRVRQGDRIGNIRILQIQETRIVVEIEEFGMTEQRIMELPRPGQGGLS